MAVGLAYGATRIALTRDGVVGCRATGFYWLHDDSLYLITNWHCVTGRNQQQPSLSLGISGFEPTHIEFTLMLDVNGIDAQRNAHRISLFDAVGDPLWFEHPVLGHKVDVVAIYVCQSEPSIISPALNSPTLEFVDFTPQVGDDAFILGYPKGIGGPQDLAIWKRGTLASVPRFDFQDLPVVLVDSATRDGMSGSPVIVRRTGVIRLAENDAELATVLPSDIIGTAHTFMGVYSGRIGAGDELEAQLGRVWKSSVVDQIVSSGHRGTVVRATP